MKDKAQNIGINVRVYISLLNSTERHKTCNMIDSIHIRIPLEAVTEHQRHNLLKKVAVFKTTQLKCGFIRRVATYKNFQITLNKDSITINGSIPMYVLGHNLFTLKHEEIIEALRKLRDELDLPIFKGSIARIDVAESIPVDHPPIHYFSNLEDTPGYERNVGQHRRYGVQYKRLNSMLVFYDKTKDSLFSPDAYARFGLSNVIRIEMRILKNVLRTLNNFCPKLIVAHLLSKKFFELLAKKWMKHYDAILKKRIFFEAPNVRSWNEFQDFLTATSVYQNGYSKTIDLAEETAMSNGWNTRTLKTVKTKIAEIRSSYKFSKSNKYIDELDRKVKDTYVYAVFAG